MTGHGPYLPVRYHRLHLRRSGFQAYGQKIQTAGKTGSYALSFPNVWPAPDLQVDFRSRAASFDRLVGAAGQGERDGDAERLSISSAISVLAWFGGGGGSERRVVALVSSASRLLRAYSGQVETLRRLRHGSATSTR
jgi:hypothetical protein